MSSLRIYPMIDISAFLQDRDRVLASIINQCMLEKVKSSQDVFYDLVTCILEQQISYRAKGVYIRKFMELIDGQRPSPELILTLDLHEFGMKKIAGNKFQALQNLARSWIDRQYDIVHWQTLEDDTVREKLSGIKGIGPWTINMILLYTLERPDIFDPNDYQLKKVMIAAYGLADNRQLAKEMIALSENWRPYRSTAVLYLLTWRNLMKRKR